MSRTLVIFACSLALAYAGPNFGAKFDFFNKLTAEQKVQLDAIKNEVASSSTLTKAQIKQKFEDFFNSLPADIKPSDDTKEQIESFKHKIETKIRDSLSEASKPVFDQILAVHENMNITPAQEKVQIENIINGADPAVKNELSALKDKIIGRIKNGFKQGQATN